MKPGDRVRTRRDAAHTPSVLLGREGTVIDLRRFGMPRREWAYLDFGERRSWLPTDRIERIEQDAAT